MASTIQVILAEDVPHLGGMGELVTVRRGYARNYLLPRKLAMVATERNVRQLQHQKRVLELKLAKRLEEARSVADKLKDVSLVIEKKVAEEEKLYGSVTERDIQKALAAEGFAIEVPQILLDKHIKNLGVFTVSVKLAREVEVPVKVWVVAEEEQAE